jgi:hypothetical protein
LSLHQSRNKIDRKGNDKGADTNASNLKNNYDEVSIWSEACYPARMLMVA